MADTRSPVSQTPLSQQGKSLQAGQLTCMQGLANAYGSLQINPDQAFILNNLQMLKKRGVWSSKGIGWTRQRPLSFNAAARFYDFGVFIDNAGNESLLFQVGNSVYSYNLGTSTETAITGLTGLTTVNGAGQLLIPTMRRFFSPITGQAVTIYCNGDSQPKKITGTNTASALKFIAGVTNVSATPPTTPTTYNWGDAGATFNSKQYNKPRLCEPFGIRMIYAGFPDAATQYDILYSRAGNPEDFSTTAPQLATDAFAFTYPAELGKLIGMKTFRLSNQTSDAITLFGCTNGFFVITGNDAASMSLKICTYEFGLLSNRTWIQIGDDLLFLSTKGIRKYSGTVSNATLIPDTLTKSVAEIQQIDQANAYLAHAVHNPSTQEIQFWMPFIGDNGRCAHGLIANYNNEASGGGYITPVWSTKDGLTANCSINYHDQVYMGGDDGLLQTHYSGDLYDTTPIRFTLLLSLMSLGNPQQKASMRNISVITDGTAQKFQITCYYLTRMKNGAYKRQLAQPGQIYLSSPDITSTILGKWVLGLSAFPSDFVKILDFQPKGQGTFWQIQITSAASDDALDFVGVAYTLSGGSYQR